MGKTETSDFSKFVYDTTFDCGFHEKIIIILTDED